MLAVVIRCWVVAAVVAAIGLHCGEARATVIKFEYTGEVRSVFVFNGAADPLGFATGDIVSGYFLFDNSVADQNPDPGERFSAYSIIEMGFGTLSASNQSSGYSYFNLRADQDVVASYLSADYGSVYDIYQFLLLSTSGLDVIADELIDLTELALSDFDAWDNSLFQFQRTNFVAGLAPQTVQVAADIRSLQVTVVPEPPAWALFAIGLAVFVCVAQLRHRASRVAFAVPALLIVALLLISVPAFAEEPPTKKWWEDDETYRPVEPPAGKPWERDWGTESKKPELRGPFHVHCYQQGRQIFDKEGLYQILGEFGRVLGWQTEDGRTVGIKAATEGTSCFFEEQ